MYKNSMLPVEPELANQLEAGYEFMMPWTATWQDELNSCVENGPEAEMKIVHPLWPKEEDKTPNRPGTGILFDKKQPRDEHSREVPANQAAGGTTASSDSAKMFKNSSVIYVDAKDAQILRPSLLPSVSRGRKPLSAIRKGRQIGIAVVRGFDRMAWEKLYPTKQTSTNAKAQAGGFTSQSGDAVTADRREFCAACTLDDERPKVTDLVMVIHGIGQKLSERVESYHFTHAINGLRRQVNVEVANDTVKGHLRPDFGGIMVLPINWRSTISFEDGVYEPSTKMAKDPTDNQFALKDITPETLPVIRNLISDVMLDIPYYLSHHKQKMIQAVIKEANRVYRLWCRNNPGFQETGRVHLVAHSLGSAMAMDILSQQPTKLPKLDMRGEKVHEKMFEFDTKSLFFCGSPAGFFLLLNKGAVS